MLLRMATFTVKKYENRRLYTPDLGTYVTLDDLARWIREGHDVKVQDVKTGEDLTQATLFQIVVETRHAARLLSPSLLFQLIRLDDEALGEFLGQYLTFSLAAYIQTRGAVSQFNPFPNSPFAATSALAQMFSRGAEWLGMGPPVPAQPRARPPTAPPAPEPPPPAAPPPSERDEVSELRRELEDLKRQVTRPRRKKRTD
jgi:polyhydroxyalkanoate synthesis repressor PhaR